MVFLRSVHSGPEAIRTSFCGPTHLEDNAFAMSVDEPTGGPIVIRVTGDIDSSTVRGFGECVEAVRGRSLVIDLLDVEHIDSAGLSVLTSATSRLASHGYALVLACTDTLGRRLVLEWGVPGVVCYDTVAEAIESVVLQDPPIDAPITA